MGISGVFVIWLFLTIFFIIEFIQCLIKGIVFPVESLWMLIILWFIVFMIIAGFILYRKSTQKRFSKVLENDYSNNFNNYREGEYFYQSPLITLDSQYIPIHGNKKMYYVPNFNNFLQKWMSITGFFPLFGVFLKSNDNIVKIQRFKLWSLRPHYQVFLNESKIGVLKRQKLVTEKGMTQQLPYIFYTENEEYKFNNPYLSLNTVIKSGKEEILNAHRSFFDLSKNQFTKQRGEKHNIEVESRINKPFPDEVWIALYIQIMITKRTSN